MDEQRQRKTSRLGVLRRLVSRSSLLQNNDGSSGGRDQER